MNGKDIWFCFQHSLDWAKNVDAYVEHKELLMFPLKLRGTISCEIGFYARKSNFTVRTIFIGYCSHWCTACNWWMEDLLSCEDPCPKYAGAELNQCNAALTMSWHSNAAPIPPARVFCIIANCISDEVCQLTVTAYSITPFCLNCRKTFKLQCINVLLLRNSRIDC